MANRKATSGLDVYKRQQRPRSPYQIDSGWLIPAMMDSKMVSDLPGTLRAHVSQNVMDSATGRFVLIPGGSRLVGPVSYTHLDVYKRQP